jgi:hypothetical protein
MSIGTYSELKTAIETWMARSGDTRISGNASDIVTLAESRLNRQLDLNIQKVDLAYTAGVSQYQLALPADYSIPISLKLTTFQVEAILTPRINGTYVRGLFNSVPTGWSINGTNIELDYPCNQSHTFLFRYQSKFALSDSAPTNWLLTNHPDIYLQACLVEAEFLAKDWQAAAIREGRLDKTIEEIMEQDAEQVAVGTLQTDAGIRPPGRFNIYSGF